MLKLLSLLLILLSLNQVLHKMRVHVQLSRVYLEWFSSLISWCESNCLRLVGLLYLKRVRPTPNIVKPLVVLDLVLEESFSLALSVRWYRGLGFALMHISIELNDSELIGESWRLQSLSIANSVLGTPPSHWSETTSPKLMLHLLRLICEFRLQKLAVIICLLNDPLSLLMIGHHLSHNLCRHCGFSGQQFVLNLLFVPWWLFFLGLCRTVVVCMPTVQRHWGQIPVFLFKVLLLILLLLLDGHRWMRVSVHIVLSHSTIGRGRWNTLAKRMSEV